MILDVKLLPHQKKFIESDSSICGLYCGRGAGKSFIISWLCVINLLKGKRTIVFSTNYKQLQLTLVPEIIKRLEELKLNYIHDKITSTIKLKDELLPGSIFLFSYENVDSVRGLTECEYLVLDEISQAPNNILAVSSPCLRGNFIPKIRFASSPLAGSYWNEWVKTGRKNNTIEVITATMMDNSFLSKESIEIQKKAITDPDLYRQEIMGEILDDTIKNCIISIEDLSLEPKNSDKEYICAIDFARQGVDNTVMLIRNSYEIIDILSFNKADTKKLSSIYRELYNRYRFKETFLDSTGGYDIGFYDALKDSYNLTEVNFGSKSLDDYCLNARTYMYDQLSKSIQEGFFIDTYKYYDLFTELKNTSYFITNTGKKALTPKEEIKKIINRSPDTADALALSFYKNIKQKKITDYRQSELINICFR